MERCYLVKCDEESIAVFSEKSEALRFARKARHKDLEGNYEVETLRFNPK